MGSSKDMIQACALQVINLLQRHLMKAKRDFGVLQVDYQKVGDILEKGVKSKTQDQLVPLTAAGILGDLVTVNNAATEQITQRFFNSMGTVVQMIDAQKLKCDMKRIDGTNFGCPFLGVYDYPFKLLANIISRVQEQKTPGLVNVLNTN